ncbi:MAG: enoyl-[Opitutales bacterium]|nr:enoyl-[acyl-carrier-protein] reductase FabV [Opitutales bacterium]
SMAGAKAATFGVFYERSSENGKPASAGWYNTAALEAAALKEDIPFYSMNGDAFSSEFKKKAVEALRKTLGTVDCVIYSLAAPRRTDKDGVIYKSVLKPIGRNFTSKSVNTDKSEVFETTIEPATDDEIFQTVKVMGGEDWEEWMRLLVAEKLLAPKAITVAYSYIGPEVTWPIYKSGTIGRAKAHLAETAEKLNNFLSEQIQGRALISVNKAVVTQASSAIPVVPLYNSILFKVMKEAGLHEDCIQQMYRLFAGLFGNKSVLKRDGVTCVRLDDLELKPEVQTEVQRIWERINTDNLRTLSDFEGYKKNFLQLFGFECQGVDYNADVNPERPIRNLLS